MTPPQSVTDSYSRSFKELTKAVNDNIPTASIPLPDEVLEVIQAYLEKHAPIEESDSQRLQDELLNIYQKDVKSKPKRYAGFIAILRELKSAIAGSSRILQWWETLLIPVLDHLADEKGLGVQTHRFLLDILIFDTDNGEKSDAAKTSAIISEKLLELWLKKSSSASLEGDPATRFLEEQIKLTLVAFGKRRPRVVLSAPSSTLLLTIL
jgi:solute carrier family 25 protein 16